jgi:hypothetical protein
MRLE